MVLLAGCGTLERSNKQNTKAGYPERPTPDDIVYLDSALVNEPLEARTLIFPEDTTSQTVIKIEGGRASWYGPKFHGRLTANGEQFDMDLLTAAHRTLPFNTLVLVENKDNGESVLVRINDRGPFAKNRIIDLSRQAAREIRMVGSGTANVNLFVEKKRFDPLKNANLKVASYTIQLASFKSEKKAFNYSSKIKGSRVETVRIRDCKVYRVYFGRYIDKGDASRARKQLENKNYSGYVKQIENG